jgi:hypothetical protein
MRWLAIPPALVTMAVAAVTAAGLLLLARVQRTLRCATRPRRQQSV